ncbi:hypothetical protein L917_01573 [Phytophthora nicotianae]|uniref:Uncharacterized protein n=1 Tax=Phytophthora nicotianae TaxID=4792 RepID=W2JQY9_PHYNI|nr:hypothetical protein L915_01636 [Phytophthora nicotianae]ETK95440.1 hypothetical protein L915_01628 [Phytophthora nicotianae]ETL48825.1 hypothetical protein L916_01604 [Phytophthora nicotianae]ETM01879.1 hypothetical protein L917_01573 [Phytophthora nicotianae]
MTTQHCAADSASHEAQLSARCMTSQLFGPIVLAPGAEHNDVKFTPVSLYEDRRALRSRPIGYQYSIR